MFWLNYDVRKHYTRTKNSCRVPCCRTDVKKKLSLRFQAPNYLILSALKFKRHLVFFSRAKGRFQIDKCTDCTLPLRIIVSSHLLQKGILATSRVSANRGPKRKHVVYINPRRASKHEKFLSNSYSKVAEQMWWYLVDVALIDKQRKVLLWIFCIPILISGMLIKWSSMLI